VKARQTNVSGFLFAALAALAMAGGGCPVTQSQDTPAPEMKCSVRDGSAKYYLYVPSYYDKQRPWPMMITLHGSFVWDGAKRQAMEWKALAEKHGFIVVAPVLKSTQGTVLVFKRLRKKDLAADEQNVLAIMEELKKQYRIDEKSVMISGYSAGGFPLYYIALRNPKLFSAVVSRTANCDMKIVREIPITDAARKLHYLIFFSKRGITPASSNMNPVARESWAAFRHLRQQGCFEAKIEKIEGGHRRLPGPAFEFWRSLHPKLFAEASEEE